MTIENSLLRRLTATLLVSLLTLVAGCSTLERGTPPKLENGATWAILPFANHTETPLAGNRAEAIAESLLRTQITAKIKRFPAAAQSETLFDGTEQKQDEALAWAREQGIRYALTGSVDEWRYKVGVDGEPAAGVTLQIIDVATGDALWSGAGGKSGWSREALSAVARQLIRDLLRAGLSNAR